MLQKYAKQLIAALKELQQNGPHYERCGICSNVVTLAQLDSEITGGALKPLIASWEESLDENYPIEGYMTLYEEGRANLWKGEALEKRKRLMAHMVAELEKLDA